MVMDATQPQQPSPQSVGREFVRQYYTLLNKAPNHLHRFYNNNSSFIHGESTLVVGQKNIHNRIQQLNFHDCHAKISQVDAQATLGNGVVVQVTGELSNDGQPMRRFTQTFVLAAQSPKKYYVHNDIFRYQDLYSDEDVDGEPRSENDEDHEQQQVPQPPQVGQAIVASTLTNVVQGNEQAAPVTSGVNEPLGLPNQVVASTNSGASVLSQPTQAVYYPMPAAGGRALAVLPPPGAAPVPLTANFTNTTAAAGAPPQSVPTPCVSQLNGVVAHDELITNMQQPTVAQQPQLANNQTPSPVLTQTVGAISVAPVLGGQTSAGVINVPVAVSATAAAGLPQSNPSAIPNYQQSHLMPPHILQQQPQPQQQPQQQILNTHTQSQQHQQQQQSNLQQQSQTPLTAGPNMVEVEDTISSNQMIMSSNSPPSVTEQQQQSRPNTAANVVASGQTVGSASTAVLEPTPAPVVEDFKTINEQQQQEKYEAAKQQQQQQNEPKTYANLFKSSSTSPSSFVNAAMQQQQQIQQQQQQQQQSVNSIYHQTNSSNNLSSNTNYPQSASSTNSLPGYDNRNNENINQIRQENNNNIQGSGGPLPQRSNAKSFNKDFDQRRTSNPQQFGDSQQLFLGNIPHHASEDELKALFSRFGRVVDLRILSKSNGKLPPGARNPLNYGFITYNDAEAVQNCLANCPLYFPDSPDGQKLNVEEKKPRTRPNDLPPRQSMGGNGGNNGSGMNNNQRNMSGVAPARSLSNSGNGSMMRGNSVGNANSMSRGGSSGGSSGGPPRMGGAFNRNDNRASNGNNSGGGSQMRGGNNSQSQGNSYGVRR